MQNTMSEIQKKIEEKAYNNAWEIMRKFINCIEEKDKEELKKSIKRYSFMININRDINLDSLFCSKLINKLSRLNWDMKDYILQCELINKEIEKQVNLIQIEMKKMYRLHPITALHVLISTFENFHHYLLRQNINMMDSTFVLGIETNYESSMDSLNNLLKLWRAALLNNSFKGRFTDEKDNYDMVLNEYKTNLMSIMRSLNFLEWISIEVSNHVMTMEKSEGVIEFTYTNFEEIRKFRLPVLRSVTQQKTITIELQKGSKQRFNFDIKELDYKKIIKLQNNNHFQLEVNSNDFIESFKTSTEKAYNSYKQLSNFSHIHDMEKIKIEKFNALEILFFYYCLNSLATIYFKATEYYIENQKKIPLAPYLRIEISELKKLLDPFLTKIFSRKIKKEELEGLINLYSFGTDNVYDLYLKPLILYKNYIYIVPSIFLMNIFPKTFLQLLNKYKTNFEKKGRDYEEYIKFLFNQYDFSTYNEQFVYSYNYQNQNINGDIDLITRLGDYLFIGEVKNRFEPIDLQEQLSTDRTIRKAVKQIKKSLLYIERNKTEFSEKIGISLEELEKITIQPLVLINCFYGSGQLIDNIPIIDTSALSKYFDGFINAYNQNGEKFSKKIRPIGDIQALDFKNFLIHPYFNDPSIYLSDMSLDHVYHIEDLLFKVKIKKEVQEVQTFKQEAVDYFQKLK